MSKPIALGGPIDLATTLESGQVFHWNQHPDGSWSGLIGDHAVRVSEKNQTLILHQGDTEKVARHFALDHPLQEIYSAFPDEPLSQSALAACRGMRILRQPRWECVATFITSSMKQVSHIRGMSLAIREKFGLPVAGSPVNAYPHFSVLARARESDLRDCGLGYRAANLLATARLLDNGQLDLDAVSTQPTNALRETLQTLPGVGVKVANCILLFAYERLDSVPIDTWIHRILLTMRSGRKGTPRQLAAYARRRLGPYGGYVQQYLFHHARTQKRRRAKLSLHKILQDLKPRIAR
ncbi:MAG: DNA-3-methyladenine glycosylase family protein [Verrucomicrobiota bacterium]